MDHCPLRLIEEITLQPHGLTGLDLELLKRSVKTFPKVPVGLSPERPSSKTPLGAASAALGPAL